LNLYAETSAILDWLLVQRGATAAGPALAAADRVVTSQLTLMECERVLTRGVATGDLTAERSAEARSTLQSIASDWLVVSIDPLVSERVKQPFPREPVRTLDAIHLASALVARSGVPDIQILSLDTRVRDNAALLGFGVQPV
jgi:predicted nucleic acid-binding protein